MKKIRRAIVGIISIIYLILLLIKIDIPGNIFALLLGIVLINQAIDEWYEYRETKKKIHLLIPISTLLLTIYVVLNLMF